MTRRRGFTLVAVACALGLTLACSGKTSGGGGGGGSACDDYFQAVFGASCPGSTLPPAAEVARIQGRFGTICGQVIALPGSSLTASALEACVSAFKSGGCSVLSATGSPCNLGATAGSLPSGASCVLGAQCQGGSCPENTAADGGVSACGTCSTPAAIGQPCGTNGTTCAADAVCTIQGTGSTLTCQAVTKVGAGGSCTGTATQCDTGLACNTAGQCAAPGAQGAPCSEGIQCAPPLVCPLVVGTTGTCQSASPAGGPCSSSLDCQAGLACAFSTHQCAAVTSWASAGEPCSDTIPCLVGGCPFSGTASGGTCPTVIPDGQPCDPTSPSTATCDTFANCTGGVCTLGYPACP